MFEILFHLVFDFFGKTYETLKKSYETKKEYFFLIIYTFNSLVSMILI